MKLRCTIKKIEHVGMGPQKPPVVGASMRCYFLVADGFDAFNGFHVPTRLFGSELLPVGTVLTINTEDSP